MCFSAKVSLFAASALSLIGILSLLKVKNKRQIPIALIPFIFAIQQFYEAILWYSIPINDTFITAMGTYIYLFFAYAFWPVWIPFSLLLLEKNKLRKTLILICLVLGILIAFYDLIFIFSHKAHADIIQSHIYYAINIPDFFNFGYIFYLIALLTPFFISSVPLMWAFGLFTFLFLLISIFFYYSYLTSIWCFFAAILSTLIYFILMKPLKD